MQEAADRLEDHLQHDPDPEPAVWLWKAVCKFGLGLFKEAEECAFRGPTGILCATNTHTHSHTHTLANTHTHTHATHIYVCTHTHASHIYVCIYVIFVLQGHYKIEFSFM